MKNFIIIFFLGVFFSSQGQDINGVWISYFNFEDLDAYADIDMGSQGITLDFDMQEMSYLTLDSVMPVSINQKRRRINIRPIKVKLKYELRSADSLVAFDRKDRSDLLFFKPLPLKNKLPLSKSELKEFLSSRKFQPLFSDLEIQFDKEQYLLDKRFKKPLGRFNLINNSWGEQGYWYLTEMKKNLFLVLSLTQTDSPSVFQICEVTNSRIKLRLILDSFFSLKEVTELNVLLE